ISSAHLAAYADVDAWRGRCVRHFARLEQEIARFLAAHDAETQAVGYGLGCRLGQLATFLERDPARTRSLRKAVAAFEPLKARR
ncbi:hypothetical protein NQU36_27435, partial [Escherichia coli]|uniref:hypothetical protein n=1 Tax=Escherichia coli TaxID=562 RepID=UPI002119AB3F